MQLLPDQLGQLLKKPQQVKRHRQRSWREALRPHPRLHSPLSLPDPRLQTPLSSLRGPHTRLAAVWLVSHADPLMAVVAQVAVLMVVLELLQAGVEEVLEPAAARRRLELLRLQSASSSCGQAYHLAGSGTRRGALHRTCPTPKAS